MPDISTANQTRINNFMCPIGNEFSVGSRFAYFTTAGALSSATITAPTITSGSAVGMTFTSALILSQSLKTAESASGSSGHAAKAAMTGGVYLLNPNAAGTSGFYHLTSAGTSGYMVRLINVATGSTAVINLGCTKDTAEGAFIASASGNFNFSLRANAAVDIFCYSATRWLIVGATKGVEALAATT